LDQKVFGSLKKENDFMEKGKTEELKSKLKIAEDKLEEAADEARAIEAKGDELPKSFWDELSNCQDSLNNLRATIIRKT
jgi:hypothetical protein